MFDELAIIMVGLLVIITVITIFALVMSILTMMFIYHLENLNKGKDEIQKE